MLAAQGVDTSVITPVNQDPVTPAPGVVVMAAASAPSVPAPVIASSPTLVPAPLVAPTPVPIQAATQMPVTAPAPPIATTPVVPAPTVPVTTISTTFNLPPVTQMVAELKASGKLEPIADIQTTKTSQLTSSQPMPSQAASPPTQPTPPMTKPAPAATSTLETAPVIQLANTAPTFQRPTAEHLLKQAESQQTGLPMSTIVAMLLFLVGVGYVGWMVYSRGQNSGSTADNWLTITIEAMSSSLKH